MGAWLQSTATSVRRAIRRHWRLIVIGGLLFFLAGSREVLQSINALTSAMRPSVCATQPIVDLQPTLGNTTSADDIVLAVRTWQQYEREAATGELIPDSDACGQAPAMAGGQLIDGDELTDGVDVASSWLWWDLFAFAPLYPLVIGLVGWRSFADSKRYRSMVVVVAVLTAGADIVENLTLASGLKQARRGVDAAEIGTRWLNLAGTVKWVGVVALLLALVARAAPRLGVFLERLRRIWSTVVIAWLPGFAALAFALVMYSMVQVLDAVRRWGLGQLVATVLVTVGFAFAAAVASSGAVRPAQQASTTVQPRTGGTGRYGPRPGLLMLTLAGVALIASSWLTGFRGLIIPGLILGGAAVLSMIAESTIAPPVDRDEREPDESRLERLKVAGWIGAIVIVGLAFGMIRAAAQSNLFLPDPSRGVERAQLAVGLGLCLLTPVFALSLRRLCRLIAGLASSGSRIVLGVMVVATLAPAALLMIDSIALALAPRVGTVVVFALFFASVCTVFAAGEWLAEWFNAGPKRYDFGLPPILRSLGVKRTPIGGLLVAWFVLASLVDPGGYHTIRPLDSDTPAPSYSLDRAVDHWIGRIDEDADDQATGDENTGDENTGDENTGDENTGDDDTPQLMLVVGASGGGVRAAYWTAAVLDCVVERETVGSDPCGGTGERADVARRRSSLFLMSGVSGGSIGLVEYTTAVAYEGDDAGDGWSADETSSPGDGWFRERLGGDYLAPTTAGLLLDDFVQGFLRASSGSDRATLLEKSWERAWPDHELETGFLEMQQLSRQQPVLLLNGFSVEDGCRFAVTPLSTNGGRGAQDCDVPQLAADGADADADRTLLNGTTDLHDFLCASGDGRAMFDDIRMSTAALLSARFPYITPSGRLASSECGTARLGGDLTYVVDGGYRESSAASPVVELVLDLEESIMRHRGERCIVPFYVQIDNGYVAPRANVADPSPEELLVPPTALSSSRDGQNSVARTAVARAFSRPRMVARDGATQVEFRVPVNPRIGIQNGRQRWMVITPHQRPGAEAPLGWVLSQASQRSLDEQLALNRGEIEYLRALLDDGKVGKVDLTCDVTATQ